ncbi:MAG: antibiotic biosynthesis monooxygenase [Crocinitomicaceae bacterium]|nr:antibiotic biosynthesis monooxygenase [Crocinitomicaceae bacterium]
MVIRIVKMTFRNDQCETFLALFNQYKDHIRASEGCSYLELLREEKVGNIFFTYSHWLYAADLEKYRRSTIFAEVWPRTRELFAAPAEAWTSECIVQLP